MKKIALSLGLIFCAFFSFAQFPNNVSTSNDKTLFHYLGALTGEKSIMIPVLDTLNNAATPYKGALTVRPQDGLLYMSDGINWHPFVTGLTRINDTIYVESPIAVKFDSTGHQVIYLLINGLISGGIVTYDSCWAVGVTAPTYNINYNQFNGLATSVHIDTSSATLNRIDRIVADTFNLVYVIKGTPATIALPPTYNPSFQISLAEVSIPAGTTCLNSGIIIYDGITDNPSQWDTAKAGTITANFSNTDNPYHLAQALFVSSYTDSSQLIFTDSGQDTVTSSSILKFYLYLNGLFNNQFQIQFFYNDTAVSNNLVVNPFIDVADSNEYQNVSIQLNAFSWSSSIFNKAVFTLRGWDTSGAKGFYLDYIQLQKGINNLISNDYVDSTKIIAGNEYYYKNGIAYLAGAVGTGSGAVGNIGAGYRLVTSGGSNIKTLFAGTNITLDSAANANGITINSSGSTVTPAALTKTDDTNVTLTLGGTPTTALLQATSLALGWTGQLSVPRGGTGAATLTGILQGNGTSAITGITNSSTTGQVLRVTGAATYAWGALDLANSSAITGTLPVANGGTANTTFTAYSVITAGTTSTGAFQNVSGVGTSGQALISNGAAALPTWQDIAVTNAATQKIVATAEQTAFTFTGVPSSYNNFSVFINGGYIDQSPYYTKSGNVITFSSGVQLGAFVTLVFK